MLHKTIQWSFHLLGYHYYYLKFILIEIHPQH